MLTLDTETTGDQEHDQVLEIALFPVHSQLVRPTVPVDPRARAVHHISDADLATADTIEETGERLARLLEDQDYVVFHNAEFDVRMIGQTWPDLRLPPVICTYRCALHLFPDAPSHGLQALRYWLGLSVDVDGLPHRAWYDASVTSSLVYHMRSLGHSLDALHDMTESPVLLNKVRFGKHRDELWRDVPTSYLHWILRQPDFDADTMFTAQYYVDRKADRFGMEGKMVHRTLVQEQDAKARCFTDCSAGRHLDREKGVISTCDSPSQCQAWVTYLEGAG